MSSDRGLQDSALAIIGAGPIGLEAAAWAAQQGWDFALFEAGEVAEHLRQWGHVRLFSPFGLNHSSWSLELLERHQPGYRPPASDALLTAAEHRRRYLLPLAGLPPLASRIRCRTRVVEVGKEGLSKRDAIGNSERLKRPFRLLLERDGREWTHRAGAVIDASGVYSTPQPLGDGNIPAPGERRAAREASERIHYHLVDVAGTGRAAFAGRRVLVVGAGHSAATHLEALSKLAAEDPGTRVVWLYRTHRQPLYPLYENDPLPYRDQLSRLANGLSEQPPAWLRLLPGARVEGLDVEPDRAEPVRVRVMTQAGTEQELQVDQVLASVGFRPDNRLYRQLQVHECYATGGPIKLAAALLGGSADCLAQPAAGLELLENPEAGFFVLGNKSYGTNSAFLISNGIDQVREVMRWLARYPDGRPVAGDLQVSTTETAR